MLNLKQTADIIDNFNRRLGYGISWLALIMVALMFINVIARYLFNSTMIWQQELVVFLHAVIFLAAAGYTLLDDKHVRVDVFYDGFSERRKALVNLTGTLIFMFPVCFAITYFSACFIADSWKIREASPEYNGMAGVFILKSFILVFTFSLILQGISVVCKSLMVLGKWK